MDVEKADGLTLENIQLKLMLAAYKEKLLMEELTRVQSERRQLVEQMTATGLELAQKYGFDPTKQAIDPQTLMVKTLDQMLPSNLQEILAALAIRK